MYNKRVVGIFQNPSNIGELKGNDCGVGDAASNVFGDTIKLFIKFEDNKVVDSKFKAFGNVATIACSSMATELILGKTIEELKEYKVEEISKVLGGIPTSKEYSLVLVKTAIEDAIRDYNKKQVKLEKQKKNAKK